MQSTITAGSGQLAKAMEKIEAEVRDGLKHGHFEIEIVSSIAKAGTRELVVKAGKSYQFRITKEEAES